MAQDFLTFLHNPTFSLIGGAWVLSLTGGWHCAGMCGALNALPQSKKEYAYYQLGRLVTYIILGMAAGYLGQFVFDQWRKPLALMATAILTFTATLILFEKSHSLIIKVYQLPLLNRFKPKGKAFFLGLANGLLPCHFLYGFLALAAASRSFLLGGGLMTALWLGSLLYLLGFGYLGHHLRQPHRQHHWLKWVLWGALMLNLTAHWWGYLLETAGHDSL